MKPKLPTKLFLCSVLLAVFMAMTQPTLHSQDMVGENQAFVGTSLAEMTDEKAKELEMPATMAMAGSGANVQIFSTGLGTPTGNPVSPVLKTSSNSQLAERMPDIIDVDAGAIISGEKTIEELGAAMLDLVIETASGRYEACAERLGQDDFIPWKRGVSI